MDLCDRLKKLRAQTGESLQQVADAIGSSKAHVWELETGKNKNPSIDSLRRLAEHFRVTVSFLIGEDPSAGDQDPSIVSMFCNLKRLSPIDRETIRVLMDRLKKSEEEHEENNSLSPP